MILERFTRKFRAVHTTEQRTNCVKRNEGERESSRSEEEEGNGVSVNAFHEISSETRERGRQFSRDNTKRRSVSGVDRERFELSV